MMLLKYFVRRILMALFGSPQARAQPSWARLTSEDGGIVKAMHNSLFE
jgi:hypothetical protein